MYQASDDIWQSNIHLQCEIIVTKQKRNPVVPFIQKSIFSQNFFFANISFLWSNVF